MKKILYILFLFIFLTHTSNAQKVGLVLSGGGAKGLTHIGIIRALEENNIPIDYIAGTSMGAIVGSLYAMGYSPDDMEKVCNPLLHKENLKAFRYVLSLSEHPVVWAAWGAIIEKRKYLPDCLRDMLLAGEEYGAEWCCAGAISRKGHPHHPLYLRKDEKLRPFDVKAYLEQL